MTRTQLRFGKGFKVICGNARSQAAQMVIAPGEAEGGPPGIVIKGRISGSSSFRAAASPSSAAEGCRYGREPYSSSSTVIAMRSEITAVPHSRR